MPRKRTRVKVGLLDFEYSASLIVKHQDLDPDAVSAALGLTPIRFHRRGDSRKTPKGTPLKGTYDSGFWAVELEVCDGEDLAEFLFRISEQLLPAKKFLRNISDIGGENECFIGLFATALCDQILPAKILAQLGELGINLRLD